MILPSEPHDRRIVAVVEQIRIDAALTPLDLARHVNLSRSRLLHLFLSETGISLACYLSHTRLERGANLLLTTNSKLLDIAMQLGFCHLSSFSRSFSVHYGRSPSEYRKARLRR
jgi:transcriptional regulator GlxA family with amidase domain